MFKPLKGLFLLLCLIPGLVFSAVSIQQATYDENESTLTLQFDAVVQYDNVVLSRISLLTDRGTINLAGATILSTANSNSIVISLLDTSGSVANMSLKDELEKSTQLQQIYLLVEENAFIDESFNGNSAVVKSDSLFLTYNERSSELQLIGAKYDAALNELELSFNREVRADENYVLFQNISVAGVRLNLVDNTLNSSGAQQTVSLTVSRENQKSLEALSLESAPVTVKGAFRDLKYNPSDNSEVSLTLVADADPLEATAAEYDAKTNKLYVQFNEEIDNPSDAANFFVAGLVLSDDQANEIVFFGYRKIGRDNSNTRLWLEVPVLIQEGIETKLNTDALKLTVKFFTVYDLQGNGNVANTDLAVSYTADDNPLTVDPAAITYDSNINELVMTFNKRLDVKVDVDFTRIHIIDPADTASTFTFESVSDVNVNSAKKTVTLALDNEQEAILENFGQWQLLLDPFAVFSKGTSPNGNISVTESDNVLVNLIADSTAPVLQSIQYDTKDGMLMLQFDEAVRSSSFNPAGITFAGVTLDTSGAVLNTSESNIIRYQVSEASKAALAQIPLSVQTNPNFDFAAGAVKNFSGVGIEQITGGVDGEDFLVGYGRFFWTRGKEKFPRGNSNIFASIRGAGSQCEVYVADDQWNVNINQADVDSLINAFEGNLSSSVLPDSLTGDGIYGFITKLFGPPSDYDQNGKITVLMYNVRDDFDAGGRNDTNDKIYNPGYIESGDLLTVDENPLSNAGDILYIDTQPQHFVPTSAGDEFATGTQALADVYYRMVALQNSPQEERWLTEGLASLCQFLATGSWSPFMEGEAITSTLGNNLTFFVTEFVSRSNQKNSFLFNLYMYERYGLKYITDLVSYDRKTGVDRISWVLKSRLDPNTTFESIFNDYAVACLFDKVEYDPGDSTVVKDHRYGFINVDLARPIIVGLGALSFFPDEITNIIKPSTSWSYFYYQVAGFDVSGDNEFNGGLDSTRSIFINAGDGAMVSVLGATQDANQLDNVTPDFHLNSAQLNSLNEGELAIDFEADGGSWNFRSNYKTLLLIVTNTSSRDAQVAFSNDDIKPEFASLSLHKNSLVDRFLDMYLTANEALYNDIEEGPAIQLILTSGDTIDLEVEKVFSGTGPAVNAYMYHAGYSFSSSGSFTVIANARDLTGNEIPVDNASITVAKHAGTGVTTVTAEDGFTLQFEKSSLRRESSIFAIRQVERNISEIVTGDGQSDVYSVITGSQPRGNFRIVIPYDESAITVGETEIGLYRFNASTASWTAVKSKIDPQRNVVYADVKEEGKYQLRKGTSEVEILPQKFALYQNYPNPFNPSTKIRFSIPAEVRVELSVYNILGQRIRTLVNKNKTAGTYEVTWDGRNEQQRMVASGVYFYTLKAGDQFSTRKMVLLR